MSERDDNGGIRSGIGLIIIGLLLMIAVAYCVNWNQAETIRDLQRRVGAIERERR
jgi:hypothetical protein